jgi:hypothetical protein
MLGNQYELNVDTMPEWSMLDIGQSGATAALRLKDDPRKAVLVEFADRTFIVELFADRVVVERVDQSVTLQDWQARKLSDMLG